LIVCRAGIGSGSAVKSCISTLRIFAASPERTQPQQVSRSDGT
jgi:hypothetical protein